MRIPIFAISILCILRLTQQQTNTSTCHYSCQACHLLYHQFCTVCPGNMDMLIVKQPSQIPLQFRTNFTPTGICTPGAQQTKPNALGIILLISAFILVPLTQSQLLFSIVLCLQSFGLLSFVQVGWLNPVSYILNALQYFMPCNIITTSIKQASWKFSRYSYFYLGNYFVQPEILKSLALLGIVDIVIFSLLLTLMAAKAIKQFYFADKCNQVPFLFQQLFKSAVACLASIFLLLIQQTILSILISFQFESDTTLPSTIVIAVIYFLMVIAFIAIVTKFKISLFPNRLSQIYAIARKIIYPICVAIPFSNQYLLILFMGLLCAMEGFFDYKIGVYPPKSRNSFFKIVQFITIVVFAAFFGADYTAKTQLSPIAINGILAFLLCLSLAFLYVEGALAMKQKCIKVQAAQQTNMIPENSILSRNNTTQLVSTKRQNTEANLVADQTEPKHRNIDKLIQESLQNDLEPPKVSRDATKESLFHDHPEKREIQDNIEQPSKHNQKQVKQEVVQQKQKQKKLKDDKKAVQKNEKSKELSSELKKRYGIK